MIDTPTGAKGGRPRKAEDERRDVALPPIRVTAAEAAHIEGKAAAAGVSLSDYIRRSALGGRVVARQTAADDRAIFELNRVGVNLAQIVKRLNMTGDVADDAGDVLAEVRRAVEKVAHDGS